MGLERRGKEGGGVMKGIYGVTQEAVRGGESCWMAMNGRGVREGGSGSGWYMPTVYEAGERI